MTTPIDISQNIRDKLSITAPNLSMEIGSPERKIVDAVGEAISESRIDTYVSSSLTDIDTMSGVDLEQFVSIFGFGRLGGRKATGEVRFSLSSPAVQPVYIPSGSKVFVPAPTSGMSDVEFITTTSGVINVGQTDVFVLAECTMEGVIGNVTSNSIIATATVNSTLRVINPLPFTGGMDPESDEELRARFKATFLRNIAGTEDFYRALAIQTNAVSKVKVLGPISRSREELQSTGTAAVASLRQDVKYVWPNGWFVSRNRGTEEEQFFTSAVDYTVNRTVNPPQVQPTHAYLTTAGNTYEFEYEYCSQFSRNDPNSNITDKVDIFINGTNTIEVAEETIISSLTLNTTANSPLNVNNFLRRDTNAVPATGLRVQFFGSTPIVSPPSSISVGSTTYLLGTHYVQILDNTLLRGSDRESSGILWITSTPPAAGSACTIAYSYNRLPQVLNAILREKKQITTDPLVHEARYRYFNVNLIVMYNQQVNIATVNTGINAALTRFFSQLDFGDWVQMSDIIGHVHSVPGVDNVRISTNADSPGKSGVQEVSQVSGSPLNTYTQDFKLKDTEVGIFAQSNIIRRSPNNFGG